MHERPLQIYLRPDQDRALRRMAEKEKISIAELIRRGVDRVLMDAPLKDDPAMRLIALGESGKSDLARAHDKYIARAHRRKRR
ncbi:MAG: ribbon-helix-helix protein, CopG family [Chloroflexi bacterium]|nr:ribbon-helix-helix protein, CopG family [Chloroflexota bacterium]